MFGEILWALWFFLPAGLANVAPILANKVPYLNQFSIPMDFGKEFRGKRILGDHKTWRGIFSGMVLGALFGVLQIIIVRNFDLYFLSAVNFDYDSSKTILLGLLLGLGALLGDATKSFFKRQLNIKSGDSWFPFDQIDYIVGGCLFASTLVVLNPKDYLNILIVWFGLHLLFSYIGFLLKLKDKPI